MVLKRASILCLLVLLLQACSNIQKQSVVAVNSGGSGAMSSSSETSTYTPSPKAVFDLLDKASLSAEDYQWSQALRYLDQAQRMAPDEAKVYLAYGEYYLAQQKFAKASAMFKRTLTLSDAGNFVYQQAQRYLNQLD